MSKVCPQRIIGQAVSLLDQFLDEQPEQDDLTEAAIFNIQELKALSLALYRDGIYNIEEWSGDV